jgi:hypothetical protein
VVEQVELSSIERTPYGHKVCNDFLRDEPTLVVCEEGERERGGRGNCSSMAKEKG